MNRHGLRGVAALGAAALALSACGREEPAPSTGEPADAPGTAPGIAEAPADPARPHLRDGLWVMTTEDDGVESVMRLCVDADLQERMSVLGSQMAGGACQESDVAARPAGGWTVRSVCDMGAGGRVVSDGVVTGDMREAYRNETTVVVTGAAVPHMNRTTTQVTEGRHQGACPDGMRPGDIEAPGGVRLNMLDMAEMAARMGAP